MATEVGSGGDVDGGDDKEDEEEASIGDGWGGSTSDSQFWGDSKVQPRFFSFMKGLAIRPGL